MPRSRHITESNDDCGHCSAWIDDKKRCCLRPISAADRKRRGELIQLMEAPNQQQQHMEEAARLYFCKGWHRPGGKHSVETSALTVVASWLREDTSREKSQTPATGVVYTARDAEETPGQSEVTETGRGQRTPLERERRRTQLPDTFAHNEAPVPGAIQEADAGSGGRASEGSTGDVQRGTSRSEERPSRPLLESSSAIAVAGGGRRSPRQRPLRRGNAKATMLLRRSARIAAQHYATTTQTFPAPFDPFSQVRKSARIAARRRTATSVGAASAPSRLPSDAEAPASLGSTAHGLEKDTGQHCVGPQEAAPSEPSQLRRSERIRVSLVIDPPSETSQSSLARTRRLHTFGTKQIIANARAKRDIEEEEDCYICIDKFGSDGPWARCNHCSNDYHLQCLKDWLLLADFEPKCGFW